MNQESMQPSDPASLYEQRSGWINARSASECFLCGATGALLYSGLQDRIFSAPGIWELVRCTNAACGLAWLHPRATAEDLHRAYETYYTHTPLPDTLAYRLRQRIKRGYAGLAYGYAKKVSLIDRLLAIPVLFLPALRLQVAATTLMYLHGNHPGHLLEIGCGAGTFLVGIRELGWEVDGVELDPKAVEAVYKNYGLRLRTGTVEEQRFPDCSFDAIVMSHVLEHLTNPAATLAECRRILRPDGKLVITTPNIESLGHRQFGVSWVNLDPPRHLYLFSLETVETLLRRCELKPASLQSTARWADGVWLLSEAIRCRSSTRMDEHGDFLTRLRAKVFQLAEMTALIWEPTVGEEIVAIATR